MGRESRHAEIAGAGFAGLAAAVALLDRGWTVRVHERTPAVRSEGFGVAMHANGLRVLEALGVRRQIEAGSMLTTHLETRDEKDRVIMSVPSNGLTRRVSRQLIVEALAQRAQALGGEIVTGSEAVDAEQDGILVTADGKRFAGDLVIIADGVNSRIRDRSDLVKERTLLGDGALRLVVPRLGGRNPSGAAPTLEYWSGTRRIIVSDCSDDETYIAMSSSSVDNEGKAIPISSAAWQASFPHLADLIAHITAHAPWERVQWAPFQVLRLKAWSRARVAFLGDAAHAMPPNLGQGGGCAIMNALSLGHALSQRESIEDALASWERQERPLTEHTQRVSYLYSQTTFWPAFLRSWAFKATGRIKWLRTQQLRTSHYESPGSADLRPAAFERNGTVSI